MRLMPFFVLLVALCLYGLFPSCLFADYYKYTDSHGVVSITNKLESVPAKYRANMKVVREEPKKMPEANRAPVPEAAAAPEPQQQEPQQQEPQQPEEWFARLSAQHAWFKPLAYSGALLALFIAVVKLASRLSSPLLARVIYISFFVGVFIFMYKSYVGYMVESSAKIKERATTMMKKSTNRELPQEGEDLPPQR